MIFNISDKQKKKLSYIIHYYRTKVYSQNHSQGWTIREFTNNTNGENICSTWTLSQIENGKIIASDEIYLDLLQKLSLTFNFDVDLDNSINDLCHEVYSAYDEYNTSQLLALSQRLIDLIQPFSKHAIERIYYNAALQLHDYYLNPMHFHKNASHRLQKLWYFYQIFPHEMKICLQPMFCRYFYDSLIPSAFDEILNTLNIQHSPSTRARFMYINAQIYLKKFYNVPILLENSSSLMLDQQIEKEFLKVYFLSTTNSSDFSWQLAEFSKLLEEHHAALDNQLFNRLLYNTALLLLEDENYRKAHQIFVDLYMNVDDFQMTTLLHLFRLNTFNGLSIPKKCLSKETNTASLKNDYEALFNAVYMYYFDKMNDAAPEFLEEMIRSQIQPWFIKVNDSSLYDLFERELQNLAAMSGDTRKLRNYRRIRQRKAKH